MSKGSQTDDSGDGGIRDNVRRCLEAGASFSKYGREELDGLVHDFLAEGGDARDRLEDLFDDVLARSRRGADQVRQLVRSEVRRELSGVALRRTDNLFALVQEAIGRVADVVAPGRAGSTGEAATPSPGKNSPEERASATTAAPAPEGSAKRSAAKKSAAKSVPAKKVAEKKVAAKSVPAKKAAATKQPGKRSAGTGGAPAGRRPPPGNGAPRSRA